MLAAIACEYCSTDQKARCLDTLAVTYARTTYFPMDSVS